MDMEKYLDINTFYEKNLGEEREPNQGDIFIPYQEPSREIIGIIMATNTCDILYNKAKYIVYLPIYRPSFLVKSDPKIKKKLKSAIQLNHSYLFFLPPHQLIDKEFGGLIYYQDIRSMKNSIFFSKYTYPQLTLKHPFIDRLCSKIANFFNRIPIVHPKDKEVENWIKNTFRD